MLTRKQNLLETIKMGNPDRFVNQFDYMELFLDPIHDHCGGFCEVGGSKVNDWGVKVFWPVGEPGPFPVVDDANKVIKDITKWREVLEPIVPDPSKYPEEEWDAILAQVEQVDRNDKFVAPWFVNGLFEKIHYLMGVEDAMINLYEEPEAMHDLIDYIVDWQIEVAKETKRRYHPDALFQHDDWGSQTRLFLSPEMFREFIKPAYTKIYKFWKEECDCQLIVHHSDSYAAELVPDMIDMGIDVFQGAVLENNIPALLKQYGGKIAIQGGLDNGKFDTHDWSKEKITAALVDIIEKTGGGKGLIPSFTMGGPGTTFDGAYDWATEEIDRLSKIYFK